MRRWFAAFVNGDVFQLSSFIPSPRPLSGANMRASRETSNPDVSSPGLLADRHIGLAPAGRKCDRDSGFKTRSELPDYLVRLSLSVVYFTSLPDLEISGLRITPPEPPFSSRVIRVRFSAVIGRR